MICRDGAWQLDRTCGRSEFCNSRIGGVCIPNATAGGICNANALVCDYNTILSCEDGLYTKAGLGCELNEYCHIGMTDTGISAKCSSTCKNESFCSIEGVVNCDEAGKVTVKSCPKSYNCVMKPTATPIPEQVLYKPTCEFINCNEGEFYCGDEHVLSVCRNNELVKLVKCSDYNMPCVSGKDGGCFAVPISAPLP
jgi:hypothetical protein